MDCCVQQTALLMDHQLAMTIVCMYAMLIGCDHDSNTFAPRRRDPARAVLLRPGDAGDGFQRDLVPPAARLRPALPPGGNCAAALSHSCGGCVASRVSNRALFGCSSPHTPVAHLSASILFSSLRATVPANVSSPSGLLRPFCFLLRCL